MIKPGDIVFLHSSWRLVEFVTDLPRGKAYIYYEPGTVSLLGLENICDFNQLQEAGEGWAFIPRGSHWEPGDEYWERSSNCWAPVPSFVEVYYSLVGRRRKK